MTTPYEDSLRRILAGGDPAQEVEALLEVTYRQLPLIKRGSSSAIEVFHGSKEDDLDYIRAGNPPYEGGLGYGVYTSPNYETARYYGRYVYKLLTKFGWSKVYDLQENMYHLEGLEGHSVLTLESVPPFAFRVKGKVWYMIKDEHLDVYRDVLIAKALTKKQELAKYAVPDRFGEYPDEDRFYQKAEEAIFRELGIDSDDPDPKVTKRVEALLIDYENLLEEVDEDLDDIRKVQIDYLEDIGEVIKSAGYKALMVEGIRERAPVNDELLIFNAKDVEMIGLYKQGDRWGSE